MRLYSYQKKHVMRLAGILKKYRGALDLSATGTGKTLCALSVARELKLTPAVVCPLSVIPGWERTAAALKMKLHVINYESLTSSRGFLSPRGPVIPKNSLVIYDEAHRCKNHKTKNAENMQTFAAHGFKILGLSATIAHNAEHLRAWNEFLNFCNVGSFSAFMQRCGYRWTATRWGGEWVPAVSDTVERIKKAVAPFSSCMTIRDASALFKKNSVHVDVIASKNDAELAALYEKLFKTLRASDSPKSSHLTEMLRARQASEAVKIPFVIEETETLVEEGFSVVVFCNFNDTVDRLAGELETHRPAVIRGGQSAKERERERLKFQDNRTHVILCNLQSGGVGLDLHDLHGKPRRTFIFPSWSASDLKQALGRTHRAGAKSDAVQTVLYSDVDVERRLAEVVEEKLHALDTLHDSAFTFGGKRK